MRSARLLPRSLQNCFAKKNNFDDEKISTILLAAFGTLYAANAQVNVMGSEDFGRIFNLTYDQKIENRIYAHTIGNHIVFSNDNGENWAIFYSNPSEYVKDLKYYEKDDVLTFTTSKAIHFLDKNSGQIIKEINLPNPDPMASEEDIENYEVWGQNADVISVDNGQNWKTIPNADFLYMESSMPEFASTVIFEPDFAQYYLSSNDLGLVKYTIDMRTLTVNEPTIITGKDLTIYPNPVQHELNIKTTKKINQIEIYSLTGQKILTSTKTNIEVSKLSKGIYILKVITDDGQQLTQKFIKK